MIVAHREAGELLLVTQSDHAQFAAQLLTLWKRDDFRRHPRRDDILFAVREHDNGWREADSVPRLDAGGLPLDFRDAPMALRQEVWLRGIERHAATQPYAARLIVEHAILVHQDRQGSGWPEFLEVLARRRDAIEAELSVEPGQVDEDYRYLEWADGVALAAAGVWPSFDSRLGRGQSREGAIYLQPFPFAGATTFAMACRSIPDRAYSTVADLAAVLASSRWSEGRVGIRPW